MTMNVLLSCLIPLVSLLASDAVSPPAPFDETMSPSFSEGIEFEVAEGDWFEISLPGLNSVGVENKGTWALDVWIKWVDLTGNVHRTWGGLVRGGRTKRLSAPGRIIGLCIRSTAGPGNGCVLY